MKDRKGMKKAVLRWGIFVCLALLLGFNLSCGSDGADEGDGAVAGGAANQYILMQPNGVNIVDVNSTNEEYVFTTTVKRPKSFSSLTAKGRLNAWSEEEMKNYNKDKNTNYTLLPSSYYTIINKEFTIETGKDNIDLTIKFKPDNVFSIYYQNRAEYVIALKLESDEVSIKKSESTCLIAINFNHPKVEFESSYPVTVNATSNITLAEITTLFSYKEDDEAQGSSWDFSCELQVPDNAAELVETYNKNHNKSYELLNSNAYTLGTANFKVGDMKAVGTVSIIREKLDTKLYMLPIALKKTSIDKVLWKEGQIAYLVTGKMYSNPIISEDSAPDPTAIRATDGYFYLYSTQTSKHSNLPIYRSKDLVNWEYMGTAFTKATRPTWEGGGALWAPEIRYINGKYVLYVSWAKLNGAAISSCGVATADNPLGPFVCEEELLISAEEFGANSIDQFYYEENGVKYLFWGSFNGIYVTKLTDDGLQVKRNADGTPEYKEQVAGNAFEGVNIYKKNGYYYMFASINSCCNGKNSNYKVVVGRSESLLGPYVSKNGKKMLDNSWELVLEGDNSWKGPGHNSIIIQDDEGTDWMVYHSYQMNEEGSDVIAGRFGMLDRLQWSDEGWPYIKNYIPSTIDLMPVFN